MSWLTANRCRRCNRDLSQQEVKFYRTECTECTMHDFEKHIEKNIKVDLFICKYEFENSKSILR
jgi:hypothetical protein